MNQLRVLYSYNILAKAGTFTSKPQILTISFQSRRIDGELHPFLAVAREVADEVALTLGEGDPIISCLVHRGSAGS